MTNATGTEGSTIQYTTYVRLRAVHTTDKHVSSQAEMKHSSPMHATTGEQSSTTSTPGGERHAQLR